jgi:hypothetical protein
MRQGVSVGWQKLWLAPGILEMSYIRFWHTRGRVRDRVRVRGAPYELNPVAVAAFG